MDEILSPPLLAVLLSMMIVGFGIGMFWCFRLYLQDRRQRRSQVIWEWNGAAFESKAVADRVRHLREDYTEALGDKPDDQLQRKERVARARSVVSTRSYFQQVHPDPSETGSEVGAP